MGNGLWVTVWENLTCGIPVPNLRWSWQMWQVLTNQVISVERWGHKKQSIMCISVMKSPWCPAPSCAVVRIISCLLGSITILCCLCGSFFQRQSSFRKKCVIYHKNTPYMLSVKLAGCCKVENQSWMQCKHSSALWDFSDCEKES